MMRERERGRGERERDETVMYNCTKYDINVFHWATPTFALSPLEQRCEKAKVRRRRCEGETVKLLFRLRNFALIISKKQANVRAIFFYLFIFTNLKRKNCNSSILR